MHVYVQVLLYQVALTLSMLTQLLYIRKVVRLHLLWTGIDCLTRSSPAADANQAPVLKILRSSSRDVLRWRQTRSYPITAASIFTFAPFRLAQKRLRPRDASKGESKRGRQQWITCCCNSVSSHLILCFSSETASAFFNYCCCCCCCCLASAAGEDRVRRIPSSSQEVLHKRVCAHLSQHRQSGLLPKTDAA